MGTIHVRTTAFETKIDTREDETLLDALRRSNLPVSGFLLVNAELRFVSLTHVLAPTETVIAYSLRNPDFAILDPAIQLVTADEPVAEILTAADQQQRLTLVQFSREEGIGYVSTAFAQVLDDYRNTVGNNPEIQVALSGGGDGRVVGECLGRYVAEHPEARFHAVITTNGFDDEASHIESAVGIATRYGLPYTVFDEEASAQLLGFTNGFGSALERYQAEFPHDEAEVLATYWVQELNTQVARAEGRRAIIFGFNQEDVIAERLYQALTGDLLPSYPVRTVRGFDLIAPLHQIPKRLIDALDVDNSLRNYGQRRRSVSYLRSSLYFTAYLLAERFPTLAAAFADNRILARASDEVPSWLTSPSAT